MGSFDTCTFSGVPQRKGIGTREIQPIFSGVNWKELAGSCTFVESGQAIIRQGDRASSVFFIESGLVKLVRSDASGRYANLGLRSSGWLLGCCSAIQAIPEHATATAVVNTCLRPLKLTEFLNAVNSDLGCARQVLRMLAQELCSLALDYTDLLCLSARERFEHVLHYLISDTTLSGPVKLALPLKELEIAELIAVTPEHFSRVLNHLEQDGVITRDRGWIIILKPESLRRRECSEYCSASQCRIYMPATERSGKRHDRERTTEGEAKKTCA